MKMFSNETIEAYRKYLIEYSAPVEHPGRLKLNTLVAVG